MCHVTSPSESRIIESRMTRRFVHGDRVDGSGSGLLNAVSRDLPRRTKGYNNEGLDHVTPSKLVIKCQFFSVHAIK